MILIDENGDEVLNIHYFNSNALSVGGKGIRMLTNKGGCFQGLGPAIITSTLP
jgi:hypothetical protein